MWWPVLLLIILFALSPLMAVFLIGLFYPFDYVNESYSSLAALPWVLLITGPIGSILAVLWVVYGVVRFLWWAV